MTLSRQTVSIFYLVQLLILDGCLQLFKAHLKPQKLRIVSSLKILAQDPSCIPPSSCILKRVLVWLWPPSRVLWYSLGRSWGFQHSRCKRLGERSLEPEHKLTKRHKVLEEYASVLDFYNFRLSTCFLFTSVWTSNSSSSSKWRALLHAWPLTKDKVPAQVALDRHKVHDNIHQEDAYW